MRIFAIIALLGAAVGFAQPKGWRAPRTADGHPDLQGIWTNATLTPLERPANLAGKEVLSEEEAEEYVRGVQERTNRDTRRGPNDLGSVNNYWFDAGESLADNRTSLIVDPPDGRIPPMTADGQRRAQARAAARQARGPADGPEDRSFQERCILWGTAGPPMLPGPYNNNYQILQTADYVVILSEMIHDARIVPLDGRPHLGAQVPQWMGNSRGRWEGETLVVETRDYNGQFAFRGTGTGLHLVERFTRIDPLTIQYEFTIDDPETFTRPWTARVPLRRSEDAIYEYACNEGNYAMSDILGGARAEEKAR
jgi:hypothetical protein